MPTLVDAELAVALEALSEQFRIRAKSESDFRAATFYVAIEILRIRWEAGRFAGEPIEDGRGAVR